MPTDTKLAFRGCHLPSMCSLCKHFIENDLYQLIDYPFSVKLWNWLKNTINQSIDFSSFTFILKVCNKGYIPQCSLVICVVVIATLEAIWQSRNDMRLKNKITSISIAITNIIASVSLTYIATKLTLGPSMKDFIVLKAFKV